MSIHCRCWDDGEPCCWCLDDTEEQEGVTLPACANTRTEDCVTDLEEIAAQAIDAVLEAQRAKEEVIRG